MLLSCVLEGWRRWPHTGPFRDKRVDNARFANDGVTENEDLEVELDITVAGEAGHYHAR